jgi:PAS domain S-box-containing protein
MNIMPVTPARPLILNVDDDAVNRSVKTRSLRMGEMEVIEAGDETTARDLIASRQPSLILLDGNPAGMTGSEVCRRIKADWPDTVVIEISATPIGTSDTPIEVESCADCTLTTPIEPLELIAVTRAMLRLRHAKAQAREASEHCRMIMESAVDCVVFTCGLDSRITSWNAGAHAILGYAPEDIVGEPCNRIFMAEDVIADVPEMEMRAARSGIKVRAERWHRRRDGTRFWSTGDMVALRDRRGEVTGYLKIIHDRSVEKEARDALEALNVELEDRVADRTRILTEANQNLKAEHQERERAGEQIRQMQKMEALGQLTGGLAHDFNNLFTAILGGLEVTRRRIDDPRSVRLIDSTISAAQRGAKLIVQLMAFARKQNLREAYLPLNPLVRDMRELLERSVGPSVQLVYDLTDDAWPVMADANHLQTALLNLAINARDAMPDGGVLRIGSGNAYIAAAETDLAAGEYATLSVQDNGTGMIGEVQQRLFEPFFTTKDVGKGTGLGLSQVYGFVRQSGGTVRMHSVVGEGTTITILLPRTLSAD